MDKARMGIHIQDLKIPCVIGIYAEERNDFQSVCLDIDINVNSHLQQLKGEPYLDYAGLSAAIAFLCRTARLGY